MFQPDNTLEGALQRYRAGYAAEAALRDMGADVHTVGPYTYLPVHGPQPAVPAVDDVTVRPAPRRAALAVKRRANADRAAMAAAGYTVSASKAAAAKHAATIAAGWPQKG